MLHFRLFPVPEIRLRAGFLHWYLNRPAIGEQRHGLIARLHEMAAEFPQ
jgi:hypothetical protein